MRLKNALAVISVAVALGLASYTPADACCRRGPPDGWWGPQPVSHFLYYPQYYKVYYLATIAPNPYPYVYMPRGYWPYYERPYARYWRREWAPRWRRGCCGTAAAYYAVPRPVPVPVSGCGRGCGRANYRGYLK